MIMMAKLRVIRSSSCSKKQKGLSGILKLKVVLEKLQKGLALNKSGSCNCDDDCEEECADTSSVPEDVKEGHFAVIAEDDGEGPKRFVVPLSSLNNPTFLRMLERAAEEYGFDQRGAITIPCRPCELEMLLAQQLERRGRMKLMQLAGIHVIEPWLKANDHIEQAVCFLCQ